MRLTGYLSTMRLPSFSPTSPHMPDQPREQFRLLESQMPLKNIGRRLVCSCMSTTTSCA
jgi:hypothetical protein